MFTMKYLHVICSLFAGSLHAFAPVAQVDPFSFLLQETDTIDSEDVIPVKLPMGDMFETRANLEAIATKANPSVAYWDPLKLADAEFWGQSNSATIGWIRHAEIKHGRVAMAAFVGYCVQSNFVFPWKETLAGAPHPEASLGPEAQWDAVPDLAKWQIIFLIGALEIYDECGGGTMPHYMRGRKPGQYPSFQVFRDNIHFVFDLYDPFGVNKNMSDEKREERLVMEINNGRLAMLGIFGFLSADTIPGSVPGLASIAKQYEGNPWW